MQKSFDDLTIADDYMFCTVMQDEELCKELLSIILKNKIGKIVRLFKQKPIKNQIASKGVRLDIMIEDDTGKLYDIEMLFSDRPPCLSENAEFWANPKLAKVQNHRPPAGFVISLFENRRSRFKARAKNTRRRIGYTPRTIFC